MLVNNETTLKMDFSKQQKGSLWINSFAEAERWLNEQENRGLNFDSIQWPNTKWTFVKFSNIEVEFALDNQPMLVIGSSVARLAAESCSPPHLGLLDCFGDKFCLWRCIAGYQGARHDRSTQATRELRQSYYNLRTAPHNVPKTSLDELDKVGKRLNQGKQLLQWQENGDIYWHLRKNPSVKFKNIMTIGINDGHAFVIKDINKLAKIFVRADCQGRLEKFVTYNATQGKDGH